MVQFRYSNRRWYFIYELLPNYSKYRWKKKHIFKLSYSIRTLVCPLHVYNITIFYIIFVDKNETTTGRGRKRFPGGASTRGPFARLPPLYPYIAYAQPGCDATVRQHILYTPDAISWGLLTVSYTTLYIYLFTFFSFCFVRFPS